MPAPTYSENEAATHELCHAAIAWALNLEIEYVEIRTHPMGGWSGHCKAGAGFPANSRWIAQDAFSLGGPLGQLILDPCSMAGAEVYFRPSLFSHTPDLTANGTAILNKLWWVDDFEGTHVIYVAPNAPHRQFQEQMRGAKPWLPELEAKMRAYFDHPEVVNFVAELRPLLIATKKLLPAKVGEVFNQRVAPVIYNVLRDYVDGQPDIAPPVHHILAISPNISP